MHITDPVKFVVFLIFIGAFLMVCDGKDNSLDTNSPKDLGDGTIRIENGIHIVNGKLYYGPSSEHNTWTYGENLKALKKIKLGD